MLFYFAYLREIKVYPVRDVEGAVPYGGNFRIKNPSRRTVGENASPREMTLDRSVNHSDDQGSFHEVVGFHHLRNLSFCGLYGFPP